MFQNMRVLGIWVLLFALKTSYGAPLPDVPGGKIIRLPEAQGLKAYSVLPTRKVMPQEVWSTAQLDTATRRLYFAGAPGETEQLQFVLNPAFSGEVTLQFTPLKSKNAEIPASAFRTACVSTVYITQISDWYGFRGWERGAVPDPVDWGETFTLEADQNNTLLVEVAIPSDAFPGTYRGKVTLQAANRHWEYPVEVEVWPFALPENTLATAIFGVDVAQDGPFEHYRGIVTHLKYGSGKFQIKVAPDKKSAAFVDKGYFEDLRKAHERYGIKQFTLPPNLLGGIPGVSQNYLGTGIAVDSPEFFELHQNFLKNCREAYTQAGAENQVLYYPMDEFPGKAAAAFAKIAHDSKAVFPEMPVLALTDSWWPELAASGNIDVWCVPWHFFAVKEEAPEEWKKLRAGGLRLWSYMNSLYCINAEWNPRAMRFFPISLARFGYTGALWWHSTFFNGQNVRQALPGKMNPPPEKAMWGAGYLFYPPREGSSTWGSSLRWENYVQGVEEYNLMQLLKRRWLEASAKLADAPEADGDAALEMFAVNLANSFRAQFLEADALYINRFRQLLAHEIMQLPTEPAALIVSEKLDTRKAKSVTFRGVVPPGAQVTANGQGCKVDENGKFSIVFPLIKGRNGFEFTVSSQGKNKEIYRELMCW